MTIELIDSLSFRRHLFRETNIPTDNHALFTRAMLLMFNKDKYTQEERAEMKRLLTMEANGLTNITVALLQHRQTVKTAMKRLTTGYSTSFTINSRLRTCRTVC